jgi:hypothetical protein
MSRQALQQPDELCKISKCPAGFATLSIPWYPGSRNQSIYDAINLTEGDIPELMRRMYLVFNVGHIWTEDLALNTDSVRHMEMLAKQFDIDHFSLQRTFWAYENELTASGEYNTYSDQKLARDAPGFAESVQGAGDLSMIYFIHACRDEIKDTIFAEISDNFSTCSNLSTSRASLRAI